MTIIGTALDSGRTLPSYRINHEPGGDLPNPRVGRYEIYPC